MSSSHEVVAVPFGRLHEEAFGESKLLALSDAAWRMWAMGLIYCQKNLTDGFIPENAISTFGIRGLPVDALVATFQTRAFAARAIEMIKAVLGSLRVLTGDLATELCTPQVPGRAALWERAEGGYRVHDYLQWNDAKVEILEGRAKGKARLDRWRHRHAADAARNGERNAEQNGVRNTVGNAFQTTSRNVSENAIPVVRGLSSTATDDSAGEVLAGYRHRWRHVYGYESSLFLKPLQQMQLEQQTTACGASRLLKALDAYFASEDPFVRRAKHSLALFLGEPLKYLAKEPSVSRPKGCKHEPSCADDAAHTVRRNHEDRQAS